MNIFLIVIVTVILLLNLWVWLLPRTYVEFIKIAKRSKLAAMPPHAALWRFIESPNYIWFPRIVFCLALIVLGITVYEIYS
jgi:hypothetical protein